MPLVIRRIVAEVSDPTRAGQTLTLRDRDTSAVIGQVTLDGAGLGAILLPFELYVAATAQGRAGAGADIATPGAAVGGAGGAAGGAGTLTQALPIAGTAGGHAAGAATLARDQAVSGAAAGDAEGVATPSVLDPGEQGGGAAGGGGGSGTLTVSAPLAGAASGQAAAVAELAQELPLVGGADGQAGGAATATVTAPSSGVADDFNRADANPIGGNWVTAPGYGGVKIISNLARAISGYGSVYWNGPGTPAGNCYVQARVGGNGDNVKLRIATTGTSATGYFLGNNTGVFELAKYNNGVGGVVANPAKTPTTAWPYLRLELTDNGDGTVTLRGYAKQLVTDAWSLVLTYVDSSPLPEGKVGFGVNATTSYRIDDFEANSI